MKFSPVAAAFGFVALFGATQAAGPTAQEVRWDAAVKTFGEALTGVSSKSSLDKLLSDHSWAAPFARNRTESVAVLPDVVGGMRMVSARGSLQPAMTSATDLANDIAADQSIAESIRKRLVASDGHDLHGADATVARWFGSVLDAQPGDPVALLAFYDEGQSASAGVAAQAPSLTLVLVRGEFAVDGSAKISRVLYGTLDAAVR